MINATFGLDSGTVPLADSDLVVSDAMIKIVYVGERCVYCVYR